MAEGIEVIRPGHSGNMRIETLTAAHPDDLLDDHRHFLIRRGVLCRPDIVFRVLEEGRGIDELHGLDQFLEPGVGTHLVVGDHLGGIDAGERLEHGVLEQTRGPDSQRGLHLGDQSAKVADELGGEVGLLESPGDEIVPEVGEGQVVEAVLFHE